MLEPRERSRFIPISRCASAKTAKKIDSEENSGPGNPDLFAEHNNCHRLVNELNGAIAERKSKLEIQDRVRRLFIAVAIHFRHEEQLFARFGYLDASRHTNRHANILAEYLQFSDELDLAVRPAVWIECGSLIGRMLTEHMSKEETMYGI
jgi:hemerythrin